MPEPERIPKDVTDPFTLSLIGQLIAARKSAGLSQNQLAEKAKVGRTGIVMVEQGKRMPSVEFVKKLADGIGIPLSELVAKAEEATCEQDL